MSELQLGKYEFFPYDDKIQRLLLDELLLTDEEREKQGEDYPDKLPEHKKRPRPRNFRLGTRR